MSTLSWEDQTLAAATRGRGQRESFADLAALDARLSARGGELNAQPGYITACTHYRWWPQAGLIQRHHARSGMTRP